MIRLGSFSTAMRVTSGLLKDSFKLTPLRVSASRRRCSTPASGREQTCEILASVLLPMREGIPANQVVESSSRMHDNRATGRTNSGS
jgi:hypothetical protein